jgi:hypothetical protein
MIHLHNNCIQRGFCKLSSSSRLIISEWSNSDFAISTTVRIETDQNAVGTGFYFCFEEESKLIPCVVTNKHVLEKAEHLLLNNNRQCIIPNWNIPHPDSNVDLAIIPIALYSSSFDREPNFLTMKNILFPQDMKNLMPIEDIIMIGYPNGLWDDYNNLPLVRKGITATPYVVDYQNKKEFLIDMACFPGSSGSPIFLVNEGGFSTSSGFIVGNRFHFLGILHAGPVFNATGTIEQKSIPCHTDANYTNTPVMMNLGYCIKAEKLQDFLPLLRKELLAQKNTS